MSSNKNINKCDWDEGSMKKLKNISISELETKLSEVIDELIGEGAGTIGNIESINFKHGLNSSVNLSISFSKKKKNTFSSF